MAECAKKAILITGCDSGFGFSLACHLSETKPDLLTLACCYIADSEGSTILRSKPNVQVLQLDVTSPQSISKLVKDVDAILDEHKGQLWAVVNNAATLVFADAMWQTSQMVQSQFDVNIIGCWSISQAFMPHLMASKGRLVNMISFCTECPLPTLSIYTATKAALLSLTNGMRMELAKYGVDVILYNPGDHPGETPLCYGQGANYELMRNEVESRFGPTNPQVMTHFNAYKSKFETAFPSIAAPSLIKKLISPGLYTNFDKIISDAKPKIHYVNSDWKTRSFFGLLTIMPTSWSDKIRIAVMRLPK